MPEKIKLPDHLLAHTPWTNPVNPIWPTSVFVLHRNAEPFQFPSKLQPDQLQQTVNLICESVLKAPLLQTPVFLGAEQITPLDKEFLFEHFLCTQSFQNTFQGQGFIVDATSKFLAILNIDDHLQLRLVDSEGNWDAAWNNLSAIETHLGSSLNYAFNSRFGYLTADPGLSGTGLEIFVYLHLPALAHSSQLSETFLKQKGEDVIAMGMEGTLENLVGDFLILRNRYTLGLTEENILRSVYTTAMKMMAAEKTLRTKFAQEENAEMRDQVSRAFGLLAHSYQLQTKETLSALSLMKLGVDLGWVKGIDDEKLNEIFFKCQRAHLAHIHKFENFDPPTIHRARAQFLHAELQNVVLTY